MGSWFSYLCGSSNGRGEICTEMVYFDPDADNGTLEDIIQISADEMHQKLSTLINANEKILNIWINTQNLYSWQLFQGIWMWHALVILETNKWWWSIEKNTQGITMQRSKNPKSVKDFYRRKERLPTTEWKKGEGKVQLKHLVEVLDSHKELETEYHALWESDNCQGFANRIFEFCTKGDISLYITPAPVKKPAYIYIPAPAPHQLREGGIRSDSVASRRNFTSASWTFGQKASQTSSLSSPASGPEPNTRKPPPKTGSERVINDQMKFSELVVDVESIGTGRFGHVYKALHKGWNCQVAYKKLNIPVTGFNVDAPLKKEAEIHRQLRHPHIVSMLGFVCDENNYGLVLEFVYYGSLDMFLEKIREKTGSKFGMQERVKYKMASDVCCGMSYLHGIRPSPVIHGDLKIQNLLIGERLVVKISGFGLSKWKNLSSTNSISPPTISLRDTIRHIPPECLENPTLCRKEMFDVYSFGILLWEMFAEEKAFSKFTDVLKISVNVKEGRQAKYLSLADFSKELAKAIKSCWKKDPSERPTVSDLLQTTKLLAGPQRDVLRDVDQVLSIYHGHSACTAQPLSEHGQKMERVNQQLGDMIRRTDHILTYLLRNRAVTTKEYEEIRYQSTVYKLTRRLIDILSIKPVTAYQCFLNALTNTNQQHLCQALDQGVDVMFDHRELLIDEYEFVKENLSVTEINLLDRLLQYHALDQQEFDEIQTQKTAHEKVNQLLHFVMRFTPQQYQHFYKCLRETNQTFIVEKLEACSQEVSNSCHQA